MNFEEENCVVMARSFKDFFVEFLKMTVVIYYFMKNRQKH